ncbi:MAG: Gfo/Idh/MocA family oxidoreductase [Bernardetiaceae bacterium]|jgi:predicted dehydrogenase|nr:Gfo/Idh/MocA family oxidoreductase [Bernardetiaceae bacterium]
MKRRNFLRKAAGVSALVAAPDMLAAHPGARVIHLEPHPEPPVKYGANDKLRLACIGMGIIGHYDTRSALSAGGAELVAVCDLYDGRLAQAKEKFGKGLFTTRDYREVLARPDVDAVIVATPDHWHARISQDAMLAGKHVYCEKPMVHQLAEGHEVIGTQQKTGKVLQVGSQRVSSLAFQKAKELYQQGAIGQLNAVVATMGRHSSLGAWQYSIPSDASPQTLDFDRFLGNAPKVPFDATRFFRWRNYRDYGTGIPGDLFVHLISGVHFVTGALGPSRIFSAGGLTYWKDGRDVPDVVVSVMDYPQTAQHPAFQMLLQVNFADGSGGGESTRIIGSEGVIELGWNDFVLKRSPLPKAPGFGGYDSLFTFTQVQQDAFKQQYNAKYTEADRQATKPEDVVFKAPPGYDERTDHFKNFYAGIRQGQSVVQNATFGLRAAGPCLASNESVFKQKLINWDAEKMQMS